MRKQPAHDARPHAVAAPATEPVRSPKPGLVAPRVRRLGALPTVTTAFGGSFTP